MLGRVIDRGLAADGRLIRFIATVSDRPGGIARLTKVLPPSLPPLPPFLPSFLRCEESPPVSIARLTKVCERRERGRAGGRSYEI